MNLHFNEPANSRANPLIDIAYPRSGFTAISKITSVISKSLIASEPIFPSGKTIIPACSSLIPSSLAEQIIPSLSFPYVCREEITKLPGKTAPGIATTTKSFTLKFLAPQITNLFFPLPTSRPTYLMGFLCSVSSSIDRTFPTTSGPFKS